MKSIYAGLALIISLSVHAQKAVTIYFDYNSHGLTLVSRARLDSLLLNGKENLAVSSFSLDGYCDNSGSDAYNNALSLQRVDAVKEYLLHNGVVITDITSGRGHGEKDPLNDNRTEDKRQLNRRVTIHMLTPAAKAVSPDPPSKTISLTEALADTSTSTGSHIVLQNMNFFGGTPFLVPESFPVVDELFEIMKSTRSLVIEIQGHICCVPYANDAPYGGTGNGLSEERAKAIYAELIGKGIEPGRVSYKGFGHSQPIYPYPEKTEEERTANRRVEIKIISK